MISVDGSVFIQIANFIFLVWVLNIILYRPIRQILIKRQEKINGFEQRIETFEKDAVEKDMAYRGGLKEARSAALKQKTDLLQGAAEEERQLIEAINTKAQENFAEVQVKIAKDSEAVKSALLKEVDAFAEVISQKILGRAVS
ncbi:MAG: ATPase [Deltaproteobacteria bacterium]|nr:ATPase [Deltaproteobacteria bacterium]